jgi:hypothetical protein
MAPPIKRHRSSQIPGVHGLLLIFHKGLLKNRKTSTPPDAQHNPLAMERQTTTSIQETPRFNVPTTSPETTQLHQTLRHIHRRVGLWRGSHTLTRGWTQCTKSHQTSPNRLLLSHLHGNRTELRRLRQRTTCHHESNHTLATLSHLDERTIQNLHRPRKPSTLEVSLKTKSMNRKMAQRTTRLQFHTPPRSRKESHSSRRSITTIRNRHRQEQ